MAFDTALINNVHKNVELNSGWTDVECEILWELLGGTITLLLLKRQPFQHSITSPEIEQMHIVVVW